MSGPLAGWAGACGRPRRCIAADGVPRAIQRQPALHHGGDTILVVGQRNFIGDVGNGWISVPHRYGMASPSQHGEIVWHVAERDHVLGPYAVVVGRSSEGRCLVDAGGRDLDELHGRMREASCCPDCLGGGSVKRLEGGVAMSDHQLRRRLNEQSWGSPMRSRSGDGGSINRESASRPTQSGNSMAKVQPGRAVCIACTTLRAVATSKHWWMLTASVEKS